MMAEQHGGGRPRVSIGLPVYNGERYLHESLDSLLGQTFEDFELIITDNASTDTTPDICQQYANRDRRVRYVRNPKNLGIVPNFNLAFELSSGEYFKWAAHDDVHRPEFVERCVEILDREPDVVLATSRTAFIDGESREVGRDAQPFRLDADSPCERFKASLVNSHCYESFGLMRRDAMLRTTLYGSYGHYDGVLLARLALLGRFELIPEYLLLLRTHPDQASSNWVDYHRYALVIDPRLEGKMLFPYWRRYFEFARSVGMAPLTAAEKLDCYRSLMARVRSARSELRSDVVYEVDRNTPWVGSVYRALKRLVRHAPRS
jgi:glycosyltransferase involved in cell wall biosynthesis